MAPADPRPHVLFAELEMGEAGEATVRKPFCSRGRVMVITIVSVVIAFICAIGALAVSVVLSSGGAWQGVKGRVVIATPTSLSPSPSTPLPSSQVHTAHPQEQFSPTPSLADLEPSQVTFTSSLTDLDPDQVTFTSSLADLDPGQVTSTSLVLVVTASQGGERRTEGMGGGGGRGSAAPPSTEAAAAVESAAVQASTEWGAATAGEVGATPVEVEMTATASLTAAAPGDSSSTPAVPGCGEDEHHCTSGQCVEAGARCDGLTHCLDLSDEMHCPDCPGFQCHTSGLCLPHPTQRCDGYFHCPDRSDEISCRRWSGFRLCSNGVQVPASSWCNRIDDCGDNSDELNCSCAGQFTCASGHCVLYDWRCDGHQDCPDASDEVNCNSGCAGEEQFGCLRGGGCLDRTRMCDGRADCPLQEDEAHCLHQGFHASLPQPLRVTLRGGNYSVCADSWTTELSQVVCHVLGHRLPAGERLLERSEGQAVAELLPNSSARLTSVAGLLQQLRPRSSCSSGHVVQVVCQPPDCGERLTSDARRRVAGGGVVAGEGRWPWVVSLAFLGRPVCGGALLSRDWVLTAAHCVLRPVASPRPARDVPYLFTVHLGSVLRGSTSAGQRRLVSAISLHPSLAAQGGDSRGAGSHDLALLRLSAPVDLSPTVQPICLPPPPTLRTPPASLRCFVAGWGQISPGQGATVQRLREGGLRLWEDAACAGERAGGERTVDTNSSLCAGFLPLGLPTACQGDSGSPLMCRGPVGGWRVEGVVSQGSPHCGAPSLDTRANRFARVDTALAWIRQVLSAGAG